MYVCTFIINILLYRHFVIMKDFRSTIFTYIYTILCLFYGTGIYLNSLLYSEYLHKEKSFLLSLKIYLYAGILPVHYILYTSYSFHFTLHFSLRLPGIFLSKNDISIYNFYVILFILVYTLKR